jgi:hypothetical protein
MTRAEITVNYVNHSLDKEISVTSGDHIIIPTTILRAIAHLDRAYREARADLISQLSSDQQNEAPVVVLVPADQIEPVMAVLNAKETPNVKVAGE